MLYKNIMLSLMALIGLPLIASENSNYTINVYDDTVIRYIKDHNFDGINDLVKDPKVKFTKEHLSLAKEEVIHTRLAARNFRGSDIIKFLWGTTETIGAIIAYGFGSMAFFGDKAAPADQLLGCALWLVGTGVGYDGTRHYYHIFSHDYNKQNHIKAVAIQQLIANTLS
jgi:hypothetical protein